MQFLANENFPMPSVRRLRTAGYNVLAVTEESPGSEDAQVLSRATAEGRVILTFDRDYGELIYRLGLSPPAGVIYLRYQPSSPDEPAERLLTLLKIQELQFEGRFTVIDREQVRQRPLP